MCTMTWFVTDEGYDLFFNRDERLTRQRAFLPQVHQHDSTGGGVSYIAPIDADAGGTWIATNELGITVCLLNHYQFEQIETYKNWVSRGQIVRRFSSIVAVRDAEDLFQSMSLDDYRAFRMFVIDPRGENRLFVWDGHLARTERNVTQPKSSSSVDAQNVKSRRKQLFADLGLAANKSDTDYISFHSSHLPKRSKDSVCMHRDDAQTVSLSHVKVTASKIEFRYADGSPCEVELSSPVILPIVGTESLKLASASS